MRLFLGNLDKTTTEREVRKFFDGYGQVTSVVLKGDYGFVTIEHDDDAKDALQQLDQSVLNGKSVHIEPANGDEIKSLNRLLIKNLSTTYNWKDLKAMMNTCGKVTYVKAHDRMRNVGFVCFESHADVLKAIDKYQGAEINGRPMHLIDKSINQAIGNQRSVPPSRSHSVAEVPSSPSRSQRGARSRSRAPVHYQYPLRRAPSSASPVVSRAKRRRQPSLSPSQSSPQAKRVKREEESEVVTSMQAMTGAVQMLQQMIIDGMERVEEMFASNVEGVNELKRKQIEMQRDLRDGLKLSFAPFEMPDRRNATLSWEANKASYLPTMSLSELPKPVERERSTKTSRAIPTHGRNEAGSVLEERGGVTKHTAGPSMPRIRQYGGQHRQQQDERTSVDYRRGKESRRPELPPVGRGGGIVSKSRGRLVSPRVHPSEPASAGWGWYPYANDHYTFGSNGEEGVASAKSGIETTKKQPQQTSGKRNAEEMQGTSAADESRSQRSSYPA